MIIVYKSMALPCHDGKHMASSYATLFIGKLEHELLWTRDAIPWVWWRYMNDMHAALSTHDNHPYMPLSRPQSSPPYHQIDCHLISWTSHFPWHKGLPKEWVDWEWPAHQSQQQAPVCLCKDSCHSKQCKTTISYSWALRLWPVCLEYENPLKWTHNLRKVLLKQGYGKQ